MASYDKETKFYYLQVKEDFFDDDSILWLEDRENGEKYSNFYLKLCLKSLKTNGILIKKVGTMLIPYDIEALRQLTGVKDIDTVKVAMDLLLQAGLVQITDEHAIYISQLDNLIGSKSLGALKKQQQLERKKQQILQGWKESGTGVENLPPNIELYLDINNSSSNNNIEQNVYEIIQEEFGRPITPMEVEVIDTWNFPIEIIKLAIKEAVTSNNRAIKYIDKILYNWQEKGIKSVADAEQSIADFKKSKEKKEKKGNNLPERQAETTGASYYRKL